MELSTYQFIVFASYVTFITVMFGWLPSISESWYRLKEWHFTASGLFWLFCFSLGLTLIMTEGWLFVVSGVGLWITGTMAPFKKKWMLIDKLHVIGASTCVLSALIGLGVHREEWMPLGVFLAYFLFIKLWKIELKNETFITENIAFLCAIIGLIVTQ